MSSSVLWGWVGVIDPMGMGGCHRSYGDGRVSSILSIVWDYWNVLYFQNPLTKYEIRITINASFIYFTIVELLLLLLYRQYTTGSDWLKYTIMYIRTNNLNIRLPVRRQIGSTFVVVTAMRTTRRRYSSSNCSVLV